MFTSLRWRLTLFFVLSAGIVYAVLALTGGLVMETGLDNSLNEELQSMAGEIDDIVDMSHLEPELNRWRHLNTSRPVMPTIQIFDKQEKLLGEAGPIKSVALQKHKRVGDVIHDMKIQDVRVRVLTHPISQKSEAGWMQLVITLHQRDMAIQSYYRAFALLSPLLLLGLALSGFLFAKRATKPIEESFTILRNFVADAGHELNTPIAILQANVEALSENFSDLQTTMPIILRTCERMSNLVKDLLLLAQLESPLEPSGTARTEIDLEHLKKALFEEFTRLYEAKGIQLHCTAEPGLLISGDYDEIHRAVTNLLKNALNYTENGSVTLKIGRSKVGNAAIISVTDTGAGIPPESLDRIFDRFYRVHKHRARKVGGSGLGLAIVHAIVEKHGGTVTVKSTLGEGSTFAIEIPLTHH